MKKAFLVALGTVTLLAAAGAVYAMPYLVVHSMYEAAKTGNGAALASHVDFPSLRASIKSNLDQTVQSTLSKVGAGPLGAFGAQIASSMASSIVDAVVTPEGIQKIMNGQAPSAPGASAQTPASGEDPVVSMGYESFGTFVVYAGRSGTGPLGLVFTRDGPSWKLSAVRFPP